MLFSMPYAVAKLSLASLVLLPQRDVRVYSEIVTIGKIKTELTRIRRQVLFEYHNMNRVTRKHVFGTNLVVLS